MDLKIPDFTKDIDFESTPLKNIEKSSTETAVQAKRLAELAERRAQKAEQEAKDADASAKRANAIGSLDSNCDKQFRCHLVTPSSF